MRKLLIATFFALLMTGCETAKVGKIDFCNLETRKKIIAKAIDYEKLEWRGKHGEKLIYAPFQLRPSSGWARKMHDNGQIRWLQQFKDGELNGPGTWWYSNGQKMNELTYIDGRIMTLVGWKPNGEKCPETHLVNGNGVWVLYDHEGQKESRYTYKDGEIIFD